MAEINNGIALGINSNPIDLSKTISSLSQIELAQAHKGLYNIQALQQQRQYNALQAAADAYRGGKDPVAGYLAAGGDPAGGSTLQNIYAGQKAMGATPGGLMPQHYQELTGAGKNMAETGKVNLESRNINIEGRGRIAQGVLVDPSNDRTWSEAVDAAGVSPLEKQQLLGIKDPNQRRQIAASYAGQAIQPGTFSAPHNVNPTDRVTTPGAILNNNVPAGQPAPINRPPIPSSSRIMGDDEAVRQGLYEPTPEQRQRGVIGPPANSPAQRVAGGFGSLAPLTTPAAQKEATEYADTLGKMPGQLAEKADAAKNMNFTLDQMLSESGSWNMGKGGNALMAAQQYLKPIANAFGNTAFDKPVADYESFQKNAGTLVRQAVKEVSPRAAVQEFQMIQGQLPSADMSRGGFNQIVQQLQSVNDYQIAKQQAGQAWRDKNGTMDKFETDWNKNVSPTAFLVHRMSPDQFREVATKLQGSAEGRATLNNLRRQMKWAQDNGVF